MVHSSIRPEFVINVWWSDRNEVRMDNVIEFKNVYKKYDSVNVLENVSFSVKKHDVFGYIGPNGAGKTTSIRLITGLLEPTQGEVKVFGEIPEKNNIKSKIGFCYDNDGLYTNLTAFENMCFFDIVYNDAKGRDKRINELLALVGLEKAVNRRVSEFSRGMKKRLGLARALICSPEILILDEPMIGLDPEGQADIKRIINNIKDKCTIFLSSHNLNDVEELCNRVAILEHRILTDGLLSDILADDTPVVKVTLNEPCTYERLSGLLGSGASDIEISDKTVRIRFSQKPDLNTVTGFLIDKKIGFKEIGIVNSSLREKYFSLVDGENHEHAGN